MVEQANQDAKKSRVLSCQRAVYNSVSQVNAISDLLNEMEAAPNIVKDRSQIRKALLNRVAEMAVYCKNDAFEGEEEVRLVVGPPGGATTEFDVARDGAVATECLPRSDDGKSTPIQFRARRGELVPYVSIKAPVAAITSVWLGPCFGGTEAKEAVELFFDGKGVDMSGKVFRSKASYVPRT